MSDSGGEPAETLAGNKPASGISDADNNEKENESEITLYYFPTSFSSQKVKCNSGLLTFSANLTSLGTLFCSSDEQ